MAKCSLCGATIPKGQEIPVHDHCVPATRTVVCRRCEPEMARTIQAETESPDLARGVIFGAGAALLSSFFWYSAVRIVHSEVAYLAVIVGIVVAQGVMYGAGRKRGRRLQELSAIVTAAAMVVTVYLIIRHLPVETGVSPQQPLNWLAAWMKRDPTVLLFWAFALWQAYRSPAARWLELPVTSQAGAPPSDDTD